MRTFMQQVPRDYMHYLCPMAFLWGVDRGVEHDHVDLPANNNAFLLDNFLIGAAGSDCAR